jgi:hypothetical protein
LLSTNEYRSAEQDSELSNQDQHLHLLKTVIESPKAEPRPEVSGLEQGEADFVSKYLALADQLLASSEEATGQPEDEGASIQLKKAA